MKLHELRPPSGARRPPKRIGRGTGSGHGKTAGRGTKGQGSRTSVNVPRNFEGGQTRLGMRVPKLRGFHNRWKKVYTPINLTRLNRFEAGTEVTPERMLEAGLIKEVQAGIKLLGAGRLQRKLVVHAHQASAGARKKIEAAGGSVAIIPAPKPIRPKTKRAKGAAPVAPKPEPAPAAAPRAERSQKAAAPPKEASS
jgi:large subunit ribosomal protein L15